MIALQKKTLTPASAIDSEPKTGNEYHIPVLLKESIQALAIHSGGIYVDATLGGGGHTRAILASEKDIKLYAFDRDENALKFAKDNFLSSYQNLVLIKDNFANLRTGLALERVKKIDGILFDLGVSFNQISTPGRGFSYLHEGNLDMRMDESEKLTAFDIINDFPFEKLKEIFFEFGEEREAARIAAAIISQRKLNKIKTTSELSEIIERSTRSRFKMKAKARIFQALRIYLNGEIEALKQALKDAVNILNPKGRIVVISYHSIEDRVVKKFFQYEEKSCICPPNFPKCVCNKVSTLKIITKKPIIPSSQEISENRMARSAKMRVAEKRG
ncbi:MAG: 16S rRNA (cytosine(1402)-N(4))-methyltransferase RsmH [Candidatus Cloacimonadota bacterium]|nr:MAG: 16S rRNA (cytosine(1402)-N(4))-methyltransferase RsmH [Candidatus Cloacimonadota bacterium]